VIAATCARRRRGSSSPVHRGRSVQSIAEDESSRRADEARGIDGLPLRLANGTPT
jgi:hypothetical protein